MSKLEDTTRPCIEKIPDLLGAGVLACILLFAAGCAQPAEETTDTTEEAPKATARLSLPEPPSLNVASNDDCGDYEQEDLNEPVKIFPVDGVLETQLVVAMRERCVPVFRTPGGWGLERLSLRTYGHPKDHAIPITAEMVQSDLDHPNIVWSAPGPTFVLNKATAPGVNDGTNFKMKLFNALEPQDDPHACDELIKLFPRQGPFQPDTAPNCFHGDNSTNFHFHGFHVSPQPHQDYVGLELLPFGSAMPEHATHSRGEAAIGEYDFDVDRLRYTQAEGTHWYHAHKHGSTALQVLNGLVGTFEIRGSFDAELEALFADQPEGLPDRLLVVQQLQETPSGMGADPSGAPDPLINGMANPVLRMKPGEIQRWRFVGATMQASAQLEIGFSGEGSPEVRQIAMDGVQFAPQNYTCQPILNGPDCEPGSEDDSFKELNSLHLDPGVRIDLLVKAPDQPGRHTMSYKMIADLQEEVTDRLEETRLAKVRALVDDAVGAAREETDPPLLTLEVEEGTPLGTQFPTEEQFPDMPAFLFDIEGPFVARTVGYEMSNQGQLNDVTFSICGEPYDPSCVNETLTLEVPEEWTLTNNSGIAHPFHIHTNPFQLIKDASGTYGDPYIWRDVVAIPTASGSTQGEALIRYEAREFTGEFVNHCHILGHEDRGMMHNVQTVCANGKWGHPTSDLSPECADGNYIDAAPECEEGRCDPTS